LRDRGAGGASPARGSGERFVGVASPPTGNTVHVPTRTASGHAQAAGTAYLLAAGLT
jgi:hypothetical protein